MTETFHLTVEFDELAITRETDLDLRHVRSTVKELAANGAQAELQSTLGEHCWVTIR
jgi:hypothetical protein